MNKEIVVKQKDARDCGACCLLSIIKYYKGYIPLEKIKLDTHTDFNGTTAFQLVNSAKKYGFDSIGIKCEAIDLYNKKEMFPVIAHITNNNMFHFVVIYKIEKNNIILMDPAYGMKKIKKEEFQKIWNGIIILLKPREKIIFLPKLPKITDIIYKVFSKEKHYLIKIIGFSFAITIFSILGSYELKIMTNLININNKILFYFLLGIFTLISIIKIISEYFKSNLEIALNKDIDSQIIIPFIKHIFNLPSNVVNNKSPGEIMTRINELANIKSLFTEIITIILIDSLLALSSVYFLININKKLFLILCLVIFIYILISLIFNPFIYRKINDNIDKETTFNSELIEKLNNINSIKNLHIESYINEKIEQTSVKYIRNTYNLNKFFVTLESIHKFISEFGILLITSIGLILIYDNKLSLINLITFSALISYFFDPIKNLANIIPKYNLIKLSIDKVTELNSISEEEFSNEMNFELGEIKIENLSYSYDDYNKVLENESFIIKSGEKVFLNGKSGTGKSTICKILTKQLTNYNGNIKIGGANIKDYNLETIRNNITYVSQNEKLFTDTIKNNLVLDQDIDIKELEKIIEICDLEEVLEKRPLRLDTMLIDGGINLSGGEKQRIILARALIKSKNIIILDEALSELDIKKEISIIENLKEYYKGKTIIYIAHRNLSKLFDKTIEIGGKNVL